MQITDHNVNAQPFYVLINPDGEMLTSPRAYDLDVAAYVDFLKRGLKNHKDGVTLK